MKKEKTREIIAESLNKLLKKHAFEDITVNMICEESGIGRSTFYRMFIDKQDVMITFFILHYQEIGERYPDGKDYLIMMKEYLNLITEHASFFRKTLLFSDQNSMSEHIYKTGLTYYIECVEKGSGRKIREDEYFAAVSFTYGVLAVVNEWVRNDFMIPSGTLASYIYGSMPEKIRRWLGCEE